MSTIHRRGCAPEHGKQARTNHHGNDLAIQDVIETLDSFYCHNVVAGPGARMM